MLAQSRRNREAVKRVLCKLVRHGQPPRVLITDRLASYPTAKKELMPGGMIRQLRVDRRFIRTVGPGMPKYGGYSFSDD